MATNLYRLRTGATATASGRELLDTLEQIGDAFARLKRIFAAMTQQKDDTTDYTTMAGVFGFIDAANAIDEPTAEAAYNEINAFIGNGGPSLEQCCARLKQ